MDKLHAHNRKNSTILLTHLALGFVLVTWTAHDGFAEDKPNDTQSIHRIDATTLHHKVLCGYQGWFRCPGDGTDEGWLHWSRNKNRITSESLTVEMWPDTSEYSEPEKHPVPGFTGPDNQQAHLFSSANRRTVERHFEWMKEYGINGVFVQRFLVNLDKPSFDDVLRHVRFSADSTGRTYAVCYDLSGASGDQLYEKVTATALPVS